MILSRHAVHSRHHQEALADDLVRGADAGVCCDDMGSNIFDWSDDPEQFSYLEKMGDNGRVYAVHWKDLAALKAEIASVLNQNDVIIDDDHTLYASGSEFVEMSKRNEANRWRLGGHYD